MTLDMYRQAVGKIPAVVGQMAAWESEKNDEGIWTETVKEFWKSGTRKSHEVFEITGLTVISHLKTILKKLESADHGGYEVTGDIENDFTVRRTLSDGSYYIVKYTKKGDPVYGTKNPQEEKQKPTAERKMETGYVIKISDRRTKKVRDFTILGSIPLQSARGRLNREYTKASADTKKECVFSLGTAHFDREQYKVDWEAGFSADSIIHT